MVPGKGKPRSSFAWALGMGVSKEAKKAMIKMMVRDFLNTTLKGYHIYLNMQIIDILQPQYLQALTYKQKNYLEIIPANNQKCGKNGL